MNEQGQKSVHKWRHRYCSHTRSWFPGSSLCSVVHWQLIALLKLPTVQREFSLRVSLLFHAQDIFGSIFPFSIHWKRIKKIPTCLRVNKYSYWSRYHRMMNELVKPTLANRELAEFLCYWKKSQILISSPLLTLITFSTCSQEWGFDSKP